MSIKELIKKVIGYSNVKMDSNYYRELGAVIGDNVKFNSGYPIDMNFPWLITIGNNVTLASNVRLLAHDASTALVEDVHTKLGIVKIGDNVFIGADSVVLCNVRIGDNVVIGANSVVTHDIPVTVFMPEIPRNIFAVLMSFQKNIRITRYLTLYLENIDGMIGLTLQLKKKNK